ncbi:MAG: GAF domain-containing SpoIIE family protein phosphatase [Calditrichaceae bacterium]
MKRIHLPTQLLIGIIVFNSLITFAYDVIQYFSSLNIQSWNYLHESFSVLTIYFYYLYLKRKSFFSVSDVQTNLKNLIKFLAILYILVLVLKQALSPGFSPATFPQQPETFLSLVYSNLVSLAAILLLLPILISIKNLIYYKFRKRTDLYLAIALAGTLATMILTVVFETPLDLSFSGNGIYNNAAFLGTLIFLAGLSTRNSWITYLSRKEKYYYFLISFVLIWVVLYLFDLAFKVSVPAHSLALAVFTNISWYFLVFYAIFANLNFLLHLPTARVFDRKMKEVSSLHHLSRVMSVEYDYEKLVQLVTEMTAEVTESSYTWLELFDERADNLYVAASKNINGDELLEFNSKTNQSVSNQILLQKKPLIMNDLTKSKEYQTIKILKNGIGSFAGAPLLGANGQVMGILYAVKTHVFGFDPDDVNMLEAYANQAAIALENVKLLRNSFERERMEQELKIARDVQLKLLPQEIPQIGSFKIDTLTITAYEVGGDYYDFYTYPDSKLGLIIGDVSGKGTSAAFYMAETKGIIQSLIRNQTSPKEILINTNKILYESLEKKTFISLLAAHLDAKTNVLRFARAGHCPILYYNSVDDRTSLLQPSGVAVGLDNGDIFDKMLEEVEVKLSPNDILVFFTDGLSEARTGNGDEFGEERLCEVVKQNFHLSVEEIKDKIIDEILGFMDGQNLHDDLTLILIKI